MLGFTGILLQEVKYVELAEVVKSLCVSTILSETDSPHLLVPVHQREKYNTPCGVATVCDRTEGYPLKEVLTAKFQERVSWKKDSILIETVMYYQHVQ